MLGSPAAQRWKREFMTKITFPLLEDATIALMDIDPDRLGLSKQAAEKITRLGRYPARVRQSSTALKRSRRPMLS